MEDSNPVDRRRTVRRQMTSPRGEDRSAGGDGIGKRFTPISCDNERQSGVMISPQRRPRRKDGRYRESEVRGMGSNERKMSKGSQTIGIDS